MMMMLTEATTTVDVVAALTPDEVGALVQPRHVARSYNMTYGFRDGCGMRAAGRAAIKSSANDFAALENPVRESSLTSRDNVTASNGLGSLRIRYSNSSSAGASPAMPIFSFSACKATVRLSGKGSDRATK